MGDATWRVPVPLAATVRREDGKYYRFPVAYWMGTNFSLCLVLVEVVCDAGAGRPTVVLHGLKTDCGPSLTNSIEHAAAAVADLVPTDILDPRSVRWVQAPEDESSGWREVAFGISRLEGDRWRFQDPSWKASDPVWFDEATDNAEVFYATEYRPIPDNDRVELRLDAGNCHERRTGRCSLELDAPLDEDESQASWDHCREFADFASLWMFVKDYLRRTGDELGGVSEAVDAARSGWSAPYGTINEVGAEQVDTAYNLYRNLGPSASWIESGCWSFTDGQHRWCAARHAGLDVPIELTVIRRRLENDPARNLALDDNDG